MTYQELLKDGRWQVKKTEIMTRDNFTCRLCGARASDGVTLNVHHIHYNRGAAPWDYDNSELITLCESCHKMEHSKINEQIYNLRIGDLICYWHSDYKNYGIVYDVDFINMKAKLASVDDGGDYTKFLLEEMVIQKDGTLTVYQNIPVKRVKDFCDDYFWDCIVCNVAKVKENYKRRNHADYDVFRLDVMDELKRFASNYKTILDNNSILRDYIEKRSA